LTPWSEGADQPFWFEIVAAHLSIGRAPMRWLMAATGYDIGDAAPSPARR
jgi:hypothetical protein